MTSQPTSTTPVCPMSLVGQLIFLAVDVERANAESVKRAEAANVGSQKRQLLIATEKET